MAKLYAQCTIALPLTEAEREHNRNCGPDLVPFQQEYVQRGQELADGALRRLGQDALVGGEPSGVSHLDVLIDAGAIADTPPTARVVEIPADGTTHVTAGDDGAAEDRRTD